MRLNQVLAGAAAVAIAVTITVGAPATAATGANYVALGDSYSAGVGADDYIGSSGSCDRTPKAAAALWASSHHAASFDFAACSGAPTNGVLSGQLGGLSARTTLVTITAGGDDAGFTSVMETCIKDVLGNGCRNAVDNAETFIRNTLPGRLDSLYARIKSDAPHALVIVLGYPEFYHISNGVCIGLSNTKRGYLNGGADLLDTTMHTAATRYGFTFDDVRGAFSSHEICSSDSWLHSVDIDHITDSYHPTAAGYADGYLPTINAITG